MAKRIITADIHAANHKDFGVLLSNGRNSRLQACLNVLETIKEFAKKNGISKVDILGDLFHVRGRIETVVYDAIFDVIKSFDPIEVILLAGNHDQAIKDGSVTSLKPFGELPNVTVITAPTQIGGTKYVPYFDKFDPSILTKDKWAKYLMMHQGVSGALVGASNYVIGTCIEPSDLEPSGYKKIFLGHYHKHQTMGKGIIIVGSPLQHNFGERGEVKGFIVLDDETDKWTFCQLANLPQFIQVDVESDEDLQGKFNEQDYVRFVVKSKKFKSYDFSKFAPSCKVEYDVPRQFETRLEIHQDESDTQIFDNYVQKFKVPLMKRGLDLERLREAGRLVWKKYEEAQNNE